MSLVSEVIDVQENDIIKLAVCHHQIYENKTIRSASTYMTVETV